MVGAIPASGAGTGVAAVTAVTARGPDRAPSSTNPISAEFADTYADPAVIRGKDGWWYAYGTTDPLLEGEGTRHLLPISRSADLVEWEYVGDAFTEATIPSWADTAVNAALWAPDIRYVDGEYRLYYVVTESNLSPERNDNAVGVATAPTPTGPWTDSGDPVVDPWRAGPDNYLWTFDPNHVMAEDGTEYLFYGSYYGGIWVTELDETGTEAVGEPTQVAIDNKFEGAYVVQRDDWWYLFASTANCCAGPTTGYSVQVGRSQDLTGPYVDRQGVPLLDSRAGGTPTLYQNGNTWIGTGHNAVVRDLAGQDWIVYHALDREDPFLDEPFGINERPMLMDRLDWIDGWPEVNAGAGPSEGPMPGPVTDGRFVTTFDDGLPHRFDDQGAWTTAEDPQSGTYAAASGDGEHLLVTQPSAPRDVRVEADFRLADAADAAAYGLVAASRWQAEGPKQRNSTGTAIQAFVDPAAGELVLRTVRRGETTAEVRQALPEGHTATWHSLALEVRDGVATAELTEARLFDPLADVELTLPAGTRLNGQAGAYAGDGGVHVDNLSVVEAAEPVTEAVPRPTPGTLLPEYSDEFAGPDLEGWTVLDAEEATVVDGELTWDVEAGDLGGPGRTAGLLLRDPPEGDWTVETQLQIDLGTDDIRNFQQGGLVVYANDDLWLRLSHVAIWNTRQTEFGKEMPFADGLSYGGTIIGPPGDTTWLRIVHRTDAAGENEFQAFTSNDGSTWVAGGTWTLPAGTDFRIGLISHGLRPDANPEPATSEFDYFRVYAD
ncbi:family 43 glycosylhydrolase [Cellulomonas fimi]|uniref:Family 43 glycosylhydrolase n=1 Tax=Cellulomonas fimi TaxID=1708 RepID=A0A7Y0LYI0_CELFI|nr:family 43 glycosylhydrolase [Cellulomonas fimi]